VAGVDAPRARDAHPADDHAGRILAVGFAYREWALTHPQDYALIFGTPIPGYHAPEELTVPAAKRAMDMFVDALAAALEAGKARPAPEYAKPSPALQKQLNAWKQNYGYTAPTAAMHLALAGWARAHGLVALELFGQIQPMLSDPAVFFRNEMINLLKAMGIEINASSSSAE